MNERDRKRTKEKKKKKRVNFRDFPVFYSSAILHAALCKAFSCYVVGKDGAIQTTQVKQQNAQTKQNTENDVREGGKVKRKQNTHRI